MPVPVTVLICKERFYSCVFDPASPFGSLLHFTIIIFPTGGFPSKIIGKIRSFSDQTENKVRPVIFRSDDRADRIRRGNLLLHRGIALTMKASIILRAYLTTEAARKSAIKNELRNWDARAGALKSARAAQD